jgi:hypothetical protein
LAQLTLLAHPARIGLEYSLAFGVRRKSVDNEGVRMIVANQSRPISNHHDIKSVEHLKSL